MEKTFPFYQSSGWEAVASQGWVYRLGKEDVDLFDQGSFQVVDSDPGDPEQLSWIIRTHDSESYRIERSVDEYKTLLSLPKTKTMFAIEKETIPAYLTFGWSSNKPGIIEAGGSQAGVATLVSHVLQNEIQDKPTTGLPYHSNTSENV